MMTRKVVMMMVVLFNGMLVHAQAPWQAVWVTDSISLGQGTTSDVYYSLKNGISKTENNRNYHLAFSMSPIIDSAAIWANHQTSNNFTKVFNPHKDKSQFASITLADTATASLMFNNDRGWFEGAFNQMQNSNPFNFGWGTYDFVSHNVYGDSAYIVRANGNYYKILIDSLNGFTSTYYFRTENISTPSATNTYVIAKAPKYSSSLFAYFDLASGMDTLREPASSSWDLFFGRYTTNSPGSGQFPNNNVVGVLLNKGVKASRASGVLEDTAYDYQDNYPLDSSLARIGWDWKIFDLGTNQYFTLDTLSYFVSDKTGAMWQLDFLGFSGTQTGKITFRKRPVWPLSIQNLPSVVNQLALAPNPAQNQFHILMDMKQGEKLSLNLLDIQGRPVYQQQWNTQSGLNTLQVPVTSFPAGTYIVHIQGANWKMSEKVMIRN